MKNQSITNLFETILNEMVNYTYVPSDYIGKTTTETHKDEQGNTWYTTTFESNDGTYTQTTSIRSNGYDLTNPNYFYDKKWFSSKNWGTPKTTSETKKSEPATTIAKLNEKLKTAIDTQNYEDAVRYRDEIRSYEKTYEEVSKLRSELESHLSTQNYEKAIEVRDRIRKIEKTK